MPLTADSIQLGPFLGVRYDLPVEEVGPNELFDMENTRVGQGGEVEQRPGTKSYQAAAALGSTPTLTMAAQFNSDASTEHVVIVAGAAIYKYDSGWSAITGAVTATAGDDNTWEWADANGTLVATNGVDTNAWKWSGTGNATDLDDDARFTKGKHIAWFDNRLWIGNVNGATNQLWYSDTADIETWGPTSFFNFGGIVTGLIPTQNALTVHTTDGIYTLVATGDATVPYRANKQTQKAAIDGRSCVALPGDTQLMVLEDGIYQWSGGAQLDKVSGHLDGGYWPTINTARLKQSFAEYFPRENEVWFALPYGASQTNMNHIMVYNIRKQRWYGPYTGWERNCMALIDDKIHAGDFDGILWDHDSSDKDDAGTAISSKAETGAPAPLGADVRVRFLNARHFYDAKGDWDLNVIQRGGELDGTVEVLNLTGTGFQLDVDALDLTELNSLLQLSQDLPLTGYGPQTSIRWAMNQVAQDWRIRKALVRFKPLGRHLKDKPSD